MGNELAKIGEFKTVLNEPSFRNQVRTVLKENAGGFIVSMLDLYSNDKHLQNCDPNKVARECMKAAVLNLPLVKSLGFAYVVPYKGEPTFTIGYKGLIQLAQRTGLYKCINADVVYDGELIGFNKLSGEIDLSGEKTSEDVIGYFAYIKLVSGFEKVLFMSTEQTLAWAQKYSPSYNSNSSPWKKEFDKMALKTVLRRLISTYGAMTTEMFDAFENDDKGVTPVQEIAARGNKGEAVGFEDNSIIDAHMEGFQASEQAKCPTEQASLEEAAGF